MSERPALGAILRERSSEILASWIVRFERSPLRFRRATKASAGGAQDLKMGSHATRELERSAAFLGAQFSSEGATGYDVAAMLLELKDVIAEIAHADDQAPLSRMFEWLTVVALDGFATSGLQSLRERQAEQLEVGTPVTEILPRVPAVLLVGAPSASLVDNLLARAWMLAIGTGAPCLIIDCAGLAEPGERAFEQGYQKFLEQAEGAAIQVLLSSARRGLRERTAAATTEKGVPFQHFDRLDTAVAHSLDRAGHLLMRRS
jgi:hypothetical protein